MIKTNLAVIDLGTNTFTILIATPTADGNFTEILRDRVHVNLASEGIATIADAPFERGLQAMHHFANIIAKNQVAQVRAIGTAALRTASNGKIFTQAVFEKTNIQVEIIDGEEEASLIYSGVSAAYPFGEHYDLIMDIGGGSVEFIVANKNGFLWKQSFPVGVAVLNNNFHQQEPITQTEIVATEAFLSKQLQPLIDIIKKNPVQTLVGASGTFDVLERIYANKASQSNLYNNIANADAYHFYELVKNKTASERLALQLFAKERNSMIVVAMILMTFVITNCQTQQISACAYAMKEGILKQLITKL